MSKKQRNKRPPKYRTLIPAPEFGSDKTPAFGVSASPRPYFSHKDVCTGDYCIKRCSFEQMRQLFDKLRVLSTLEWRQIETSPREKNGFEMLPVKMLKASMPSGYDQLEQVMVFRFGQGRIVGHRRADRFYILFVDRDFTLYEH